jgi:hypothetical protein
VAATPEFEVARFKSTESGNPSTRFRLVPDAMSKMHLEGAYLAGELKHRTEI